MNKIACVTSEVVRARFKPLSSRLLLAVTVKKRRKKLGAGVCAYARVIFELSVNALSRVGGSHRRSVLTTKPRSAMVSSLPAPVHVNTVTGPTNVFFWLDKSQRHCGVEFRTELS